MDPFEVLDDFVIGFTFLAALGTGTDECIDRFQLLTRLNVLISCLQIVSQFLM